ncbi:MAG: phosphotransferase [Bdellovibrionales bacterium]|nr:phosphotransferase [Bdellovibrionales bacterium]
MQENLLEKPVLQFLENSLNTDQFQTYPLAGDASNRRYYRVVCGEKSWVLMSWEPFFNEETFPFLNIQKYFKTHQIHVPEILSYSNKLGQVLLEDLGDLTLERKFWENQNQDLSLPYYHLALEELIKIHFKAGLQHEPSCSAFQNEFDCKKLLWEMNYGREHLLEKLLNIRLNPNVSQKLDDVFLKICEPLAKEPKVIVHRDYHSRNLMLKLGKIRVIDFQDARKGAIQYDLVSLLFDSYVNLNDKMKDSLIHHYLEKAQPYLSQLYGHTFSQENFNRILNYQILQRCFKACGSFASFYNMRQDQRYLKYLSPTLHTVVEVAQRLEPFQEFARFLIDHGVLEKNFEDLCAP